MSQEELFEHRAYLADGRRTSAYEAALREVVLPGDTVLDLGSGTGILGYLACRVGAGSVIAIERGEIIALARSLAEDNGWGGRVRHIQAMSTEVKLNSLADVVVCDQIGGLVHDAGILRYFADARRRLIAPNGVLVPAAFRIYLAPVTFDNGREAIEYWSSRPAGLDVSAARSYAANTEWQYRDVSGSVPLSAGRELANFPADLDEPISGSAAFDVEKSGRFDGFIGWFEAQLSPSVTLTNDPWSPDRIDRWCNFYPVDPAAKVKCGDRVEVRLDIRPRLNLVSWNTTVQRGDEAVQRYRHSTYAASFMTRSSLGGRADDAQIQTSSRADVVQQILGLADGSRSRIEIVSALTSRVGADFATEAQLDIFVRKTLELLKTTP